jgi:hypothetical protein
MKLSSTETGRCGVRSTFLIVARKSPLSFFALFLIYMLELPKEPSKDNHETQDNKNNEENVHESISPSFLIKSSHVRYSLTMTIPKSIAMTIPKTATNTPSDVNPLVATISNSPCGISNNKLLRKAELPPLDFNFLLDSLNF